MTKPLLAILLLTTTALCSPAIAATEEELDWIFDQVFSGEVDGKAIFCIDEKSVTPYGWERGNPLLGIEFTSGGAVEYSIKLDGTSAVLVKSDGDDSYTATTETIRWGHHTLNRATLALRFQIVFPHVGPLGINYQCELADSPDALRKTMESARLETQKRIDEQMSNNKI